MHAGWWQAGMAAVAVGAAVCGVVLGAGAGVSGGRNREALRRVGLVLHVLRCAVLCVHAVHDAALQVGCC